MEGATCKQCAADGRNTKLCLFQINLEEAIWMCPSKECTFPMGEMMAINMLVKRNVADITDLKRRKVKVKRSRSATTAPLVPSKMRPATNEAATLERRTTLFSSCQSNIKVVECQLPVVVDAPRTHSSYVADRRHRNDVANPTSDTDMSPLIVPVSSPNEVTSAVPPSSSTDHGVAKSTVNNSRTVKKNPSLISLLNSQVKSTDSAMLRTRKYLQWSNVDALCWMDVALCLLVHCVNLKVLVETSGADHTSLVRRLILRYNEILASWDSVALSTWATGDDTKPMSLETSVGKVSVKTGGGGLDHLVIPLTDGTGANSSCDTVFLPSHRLNKLCYSASKESPSARCDMKPWQRELSVTLQTACQMLTDIRDDVLTCQPKLLCERGHNHSPVFALPLLLGDEDKAVHDHFRVEYCWRMKCTQCHYCHEDRVAKTVPTFPAVPSDFSMQQPYFLRSCFKCASLGQRVNMHIERMPPVLLMHFVDGLGDPQLTNYDFQFGTATYAITGLIQCKTAPDHFIAWIRDVGSGRWMMCDDLQTPICEFSGRIPIFPPSEVHIMMWERQDCRVSPVANVMLNLPTSTRDIMSTAVTTRPTCMPTLTTSVASGISTVTTTIPPGVSTVLAAPVIMTPALVATNTTGGQQLPVTWMTVSPVRFVPPVRTPLTLEPPTVLSSVTKVTGSSVVDRRARTKKTVHVDNPRLQRSREKFERAKAMRQCTVTRSTVVTPAPPTVIAVPNLACVPLQANSWATSALDANKLPTLSVFSQSSLGLQPGHSRGPVSHGTTVLSSQKPPVTSNVKLVPRVVRAVPVFAGYTAKILAHKHEVNSLNAAAHGGANSSEEAKCGVNTSTTAKCSASMSSTQSDVAHSNNTTKKTASKKRSFAGKCGGRGKRGRLSDSSELGEPATLPVTYVNAVTRAQTQASPLPPEAVVCPCEDRVPQTSLADTGLLNDLCSTLNISSVIAESPFGCDDVIDFDSLLAV